MLALLAAPLLLVVPHDVAARGEFRLLERWAERVQLVVALGRGNAISDSAREALERWPGLVAVELLPPLAERDARALGKLHHLAARLPPARTESPFISLRAARREVPSLALLGPALVRVERTPATPLTAGPCPKTELRELPEGGLELRVERSLSQCLLDWLHVRLDPRAEGPGDLPPASGK